MGAKVFVLNGPNLNLLGLREPEVYGRDTLEDIGRACAAKARGLGLEVEFRQSNHEGVLVDWVHEAREEAQGLVINAGGYSHTSVALRDAVLTLPPQVVFVEVHLSNLFKRESFRHHSYLSDVALGLICGLGAQGYILALEAIAARLGARAEGSSA
ncbi:MAG: type II 3-dehydroquinate dehydratase [Alphaproteobacteria bacterium]|nr:type II 3-dehydroquinate dehydratase [Alphaproteobacteria bacterium]